MNVYGVSATCSATNAASDSVRLLRQRGTWRSCDTACNRNGVEFHRKLVMHSGFPECHLQGAFLAAACAADGSGGGMPIAHFTQASLVKLVTSLQGGDVQ